VEADRHRLSRPAVDGRLLPLAGLFISSLTKNQDRRGDGDLRGVPDAVGDQLDQHLRRPDHADGLQYLSLTEHFDDFAKGIIDTKHVIYYLSFMAFGLFLTAKSVDSERWRG
jgi:ABC-2 type transport system permease protein